MIHMRALIVSLIIPLLILGPFFPDLIVSLSSMFFLVYVLRNKMFFYFNNKPLIIFFVFCVYCILVSIFFANDFLLSFESSLFYLRIGIFACVIWYLIEKDKKILNYFYYTLIICFSALIIDGYIQFFTGTNLIGLSKSGVRISSFFGNELILGSYLSRLSPLLFALFLLKEKKQTEIYFMSTLFVLLSGLIYISGERAAFFFYILSLIFIIILVKQFVKIITLSFCSLIIIGILTFSFSEVKDRMIANPVSSIKKSIFTPEHDSLIRTAYNMFLDKPIFGHGPKMFRVICKDEKYATGVAPCTTHPHNFYIQLLAETGIIGFSFLFSAFAYVLYCAYRQFKSIVLRQKRYLTDYQVCLLAGILITVWPLTTNGNFFHNWLMIVYSLPVGFYLHSIYGKNRKNISF
ncbi:RfaL Lipid A core - O-antigen ligase and related enzymes [Candidatus Pelagibacterales bacterium]